MSKKQKLWFRAKKFGWGWTPVSREGLLVTAIYAAVLVWYATMVPEQSSVQDELLVRAPFFISWTGLLIAICYKKGEAPWWRWGGK